MSGRAEFENQIVVTVGDYRLRFHATHHPDAGRVYGYQMEAKSNLGWFLLDDDGEEMDAMPESIRNDFRTIVESIGRVW